MNHASGRLVRLTGSFSSTLEQLAKCTSLGRGGGAVMSGLAVFYIGTAILVPARDDEAIFADPARSLVAGHGVASPILSGLVPGAETALLWQPPGYFYLLALQFKVFGVSLLAGRLVSIVSMLCILAMLLFAARRRFGPVPAVLSVLLAAITPWVQQAATTIRPESIVALLCGAAVLALRIPGSLRHQIAGAGLLAGLAATMHPLGIIPCCICSLDLAWRRRWWALTGFLILVVTVFSAITGPLFMSHANLVLEQWSLQGERKGGVHVLALFTSVRRLPGYTPFLAALIFLMVWGRGRFVEVSRLEWTTLGVAVLAATAGGEEQYPVYIALATVPVVAVAIRSLGAVLDQRQTVVAITVVSLVATTPTVWFISAGAPRTWIGERLAVATSARKVFLGPGAAELYFEMNVSDVKVFSPVPTPSGLTAEIAKKQGVVVADFSTSGRSEIEQFIICPSLGAAGSVRAVDVSDPNRC